MTALALESVRAAAPRGAIALSVAAHAAAIFLLPGLAREAKELELPPLVATLRLLPTAAEASKPARAAEARPSPPQPLPKPARTAEKIAVPVPSPTTAPVAPSVSGSEAPTTASIPASGPIPEKLAREESVPIPAPRVVPPPIQAVPETLVLDDYGRALSELLARQQQYPRLAALRGWEGEVRLRLRVARKGSLVAVQVVHSSGHEVLDQHALALVQGAALPAPPDALGDREIQVVVPINYKLQKAT